MYERDNGFADQLVEYCAANASQHRVIYGEVLHPHRLAEEIRVSDFFVFCSLMEGLGKSDLEAMTCGVPVIVSDIDALKGFVNGLVVKGETPSDLAFANDRLLQNSDMRKKITIRARETISFHYSSSHEVELWINLANEILSCRSS
ncbi:glycosyltransferase family 4 protein [Roseibium sp. SCP14]|uniref:glycosyltransferase family 4 protein n=1 Tax=Roseibium sp. SCP14 TaxID=3141375 RepID=UPI0033386632